VNIRNRAERKQRKQKKRRTGTGEGRETIEVSESFQVSLDFSREDSLPVGTRRRKEG